MTNNNWEEEVKKIAWYLGCSEKELWSEISKILTKKDQEHKAELEKIKGTATPRLPEIAQVIESSIKKGNTIGYELGFKDGCSEMYKEFIKSIDNHINKLSTE